MSNRHLARIIAMQILFEWDFNNRSQKLGEVIERQLNEYAVGLEEERAFIEQLVRGVTKHISEIDGIITHYAPEWPINKITVIDRNILRLGIYELRFAREIPPKVAINESIEIAKTYGGESSGRFINGVLGAIFRDLQADKEEIITPEKIRQNLDKSNTKKNSK